MDFRKHACRLGLVHLPDQNGRDFIEGGGCMSLRKFEKKKVESLVLNVFVAAALETSKSMSEANRDFDTATDFGIDVIDYYLKTLDRFLGLTSDSPTSFSGTDTSYVVFKCINQRDVEVLHDIGDPVEKGDRFELPITFECLYRTTENILSLCKFTVTFMHDKTTRKVTHKISEPDIRVYLFGNPEG